jgi:nucleoside-diphosphate-sugar epimerase
VRTALVTGGTGLVGQALVARLRERGVRVLATARTLEAGRILTEAGAEPLHTDARNLGEWSRETAEADVVFHLGLPRLDPPLRARAARRRAGPAGEAAAAVGELAGDRPVVMLSSGLLYGDRATPAADDDPGVRPAAAASAAGAAEAALSGRDLRVVRVPWVIGPGGLARDLIVGLRIGKYRIVGTGENRWSLLCAEDAADALLAALAAPPGLYSAAEADVTTQEELVNLVCTVPGHRRPDRLPPGFAALSMGAAVSEALSTSVWVATGRLAEHGWSPRRRWREAVVSLAEGSLPLPRR